MATIKDKLTKRKNRKFVDRENEVSLFSRQLELRELDFNLFFFFGIAGVGKSFLLDEIEVICGTYGVRYARVDISETQDIVQLLRKFRLQVTPRKRFTPFKKFDEYLEHYVELNKKLEQKGAYEGLIDLVAKVGTAIDPTGLVGKIAGEQLSGGLKSLRNYLTKPEIDFFLNADSFLTQAFHHGVNQLLRSKFVFIIDTYDQASDALDKWFYKEFIPNLNSNSVIVMAGRKRPSDIWNDWVTNNSMKVVELLNFNAETTQEYLAILGIQEDELVREIFSLTDGHPLSISLSGELGITPQSKFIVSRTLISRVFDQIQNEKVRSLLRICSTVRFFNTGLLTSLGVSEFDRIAEEIIKLSFVRVHEYGLSIHELVRSQLQVEMMHTDFAFFQNLHTEALSYFQNEMKSNRARADRDYFHQSILETIYHQLMLSEEKGITIFVSTFLEMDVRNEKRFMHKMLQEAANYHLTHEISKDWIAFCRGRLALSEDQIAEAIIIYRNIVDKTPVLGDSTLLLFACNRLSRALAESNLLDLAILYAKSAMKLAEELRNEIEKARAINSLANALQHAGDSAEALKYLDESLIDTFPDPLQQGEAFILAAVCLRDLGLYDDSIRLGKRGLKAWQNIDYTLGQGIAMYNIASSCLLKGDLSQAEQYLLGTLAEFKKLESARWVARCLTRLGELYLKKGLPKEAMQCLTESLDIRKELGDNYGILIVKDLLAATMLEAQNLDEALFVYTEVEHLASLGGNRNFALKANIGIAQINLYKGNLDIASQYSSKAEKLASEMGNNYNTELQDLKNKLLKTKQEKQNDTKN